MKGFRFFRVPGVHMLISSRLAANVFGEKAMEREQFVTVQ